jgi:hypothetical protein
MSRAAYLQALNEENAKSVPPIHVRLNPTRIDLQKNGLVALRVSEATSSRQRDRYRSPPASQDGTALCHLGYIWCGIFLASGLASGPL